MRKCFVFVDESGDLGFGKGSTRHITLAAVIVEENSRLERIPQKLRRRRLKKNLLRKPELKFHNSSPELRKAVLKRIVALNDARIVCVTVDKANAKEGDKSHREDIYMRASGELVHEIARLVRVREEMTIVFDARPCNRDFGTGFDKSIRARAIDGYREVGCTPPEVRIRRLNSLNSRGLQVADFVAGAVRRKHEVGDASYHAIIAPILAMEKLIQL